jgi:hypothetical protein
MTFNELKNRLDLLQLKKGEIMEKCAKEGMTFSKFTEEAGTIFNEIYELEQQMRLIQSPIMEYGKEWQGVTYTLEDFKTQCEKNMLIDEMGIGYYATENAKSDIRIYVTDIIDNVYRNDFTHVIWFENIV